MDVKMTTHGVRLRNPAHKVVAVAAGEGHSIILSGDGKVYSWGRGTDENFPVQIKWDNGGSDEQKPIKFVGVAAGAHHSLALADDGSVWCWDCSSCPTVWCWDCNGLLGIYRETVQVPGGLNMFARLDTPGSLGDKSDGNITPKICSIEAYGTMSLAIDNLGVIWMWSVNDDTCTLKGLSTPTPILGFYGRTVVKVACGKEHVTALVTAGEKNTGDDLVCYTWGRNEHGQLGLGHTYNRSRPQVVAQSMKGSSWRPYDIACGNFHTVVLTLKNPPSDTKESLCWTFGLGENGQLGHGTTQSTLLPKLVEALPKQKYLVAVDCGYFHTSVVSSAGEVWSWGMKNGLGVCPKMKASGMDYTDATLPLQVSYNGLQGAIFSEPKDIACGAAHTVLVANDGYKLWSWGQGWGGALGDGKATDSYTPTLVLWPPLSEGFNDELNYRKMVSKKPEKDEETELETKLFSALEEMKILKSKLSVMERYAGVLHGSLFGSPFEEHEIPSSLLESDSFDVAKAWQSMLDAADGDELRRLETLYRNMLECVKDKIMTRRIQDIVSECSKQSSSTN